MKLLCRGISKFEPKCIQAAVEVKCHYNRAPYWFDKTQCALCHDHLAASLLYNANKLKCEYGVTWRGTVALTKALLSVQLMSGIDILSMPAACNNRYKQMPLQYQYLFSHMT